ncbi:MAG: alanine/ornithine racemase family PLP-dependent enzyme [Acidimicrobiales bacterium]
MSAPRLEVDLAKVEDNARMLVTRLAAKGISVTAVTKATLGAPAVARCVLRAGASGIGESRIENAEALRQAGIESPITLIRSPMPSQAERVVATAEVSCNTELDVVSALSRAARSAGVTHGIVVMVELGDLREGVMPEDLVDTARCVVQFPNLRLHGIGTNLACRSGVVPDRTKMAELSALASAVEATTATKLAVVSGGNSANLTWALGDEPKGRIDDLRIGEAILLGCEPLHRVPIEGLHTDAFALVAEVIESKVKPAQPSGDRAQSAFGDVAPGTRRGEVAQTLFAVGRQDTDPDGLVAPAEMEILGASSDHLVVDTGRVLAPGTEISFRPNYSALVRAMTSPFVAKAYLPMTEDGLGGAR